MTPHKRFSKMVFLNAKNSESALLAEPHGAVMFSCRTLEIAEPKALSLEKDHLAEPWNGGSFRICPYTTNSYHDTAPNCIAILCRSIRVRGRCNTRNASVELAGPDWRVLSAAVVIEVIQSAEGLFVSHQFRGNPKYHPFWGSPLFYKARPRQFRPPKCKLAPSKM